MCVEIGRRTMQGLLEDNSTAGALPVDVIISTHGSKTHIAFKRKGIDMMLIVDTTDIARAGAEEVFEYDDGR